MFSDSHEVMEAIRRLAVREENTMVAWVHLNNMPAFAAKQVFASFWSHTPTATLRETKKGISSTMSWSAAWPTMKSSWTLSVTKTRTWPLTRCFNLSRQKRPTNDLLSAYYTLRGLMPPGANTVMPNRRSLNNTSLVKHQTDTSYPSTSICKATSTTGG